MSPQSPQQDELIRLLRRRGLLPANQLANQLGINRSTLSRRIKGASPNLIQIGNTNQSHYGLLRELSDINGELPMFRVNEDGIIKPEGKLFIFHENMFAVEPGVTIFEALPPEIQDMEPQGFMGRAFTKRHHQELGLPDRLRDWSSDHHLVAISKRGGDLPGNLIIGKESAEKWNERSPRHVSPKDYPRLAKAAFEGQPSGSSAGGEQPKFAAFTNGKHHLVKFSGLENTKAEQRWCDLLICEWIALETLKNHNISSAKAQIRQLDGMTFLEVERFDRIGEKGRRSVASLASIDNLYFGDRSRWSVTAQKLNRSGLLNREEELKIKTLEAFSILIGDTDRHYHNILLYPKFHSKKPMQIEKLSMAPAFDKLPMCFAPVEGKLINREFKVPLPDSEIIEVWDQAIQMAKVFWSRVIQEKLISLEFKDLSKKYLEDLNSQ